MYQICMKVRESGKVARPPKDKKPESKKSLKVTKSCLMKWSKKERERER